MEQHIPKGKRMEDSYTWIAQRTMPCLCCLMWVALSVGLSACVSQGKYNQTVKENLSLKEKMVELQEELTAVQQNMLTANQDPLVQMDNRRLAFILSKLVGRVEGREGIWKIRYQKIPMRILTSEKHDRMRIMAVIGDETALEPTQLRRLMEANFDRALDARYALFQGKLWSIYLHPLSTLIEVELTAALDQVANLVKTYGTTYSSSNLQFQ